MGDTLLIPEIFQLIHNAESRKARVEILKRYPTEALKAILRGTYDPDLEWCLPDEAPPYKKDIGPEGVSPSSLFIESRKFKYFVKHMTPNTKQITREKIFIDILECVHPSEAELVLNMVFDRKQKVDGLTPKIILEAFPGLFSLKPSKGK